MRIGIDARLPYYTQAGISRYVQRLVNDIPPLDPAVTWYLIQSRKDRKTLGAGRRLNVWTPCHHHLERWAFGAELLPHRLDLLHSPDFIPPAFGAGRMIITVHDLNFLHFPQFLTPESLRYYAGGIRWAVNKVDHILSDSNHTREDLLNLLDVPPHKVTTVHLAADERFRPLTDPTPALRRYQLPAGYLLFVGTLEPRKNIPTLLKAYRVLLDGQILSVPLVLIGKRGWLTGEIFETLESLRLGDRVRILERVTDLEELVQLYNAASLLIIPSFYEGFGLPALEAMACGTPVAAADRGSLPEIVGDAGLLFDPQDTEALAATIERVMGDSQLRVELIEKGFVQAAKFTWAETARQTLATYRQVLAGSGSM